jgi:hypothetical protein
MPMKSRHGRAIVWNIDAIVRDGYSEGWQGWGRPGKACLPVVSEQPKCWQDKGHTTRTGILVPHGWMTGLL